MIYFLSKIKRERHFLENCALLNEKSALFTFRPLRGTGNMDAFLH